MSTDPRIEAAKKVLAERYHAANPVVTVLDSAVTTAMLAAADAVMFSEEAIERAANAIRKEKFLPEWMPDNVLADIARTVSAALRGKA